MPMPSPLDAASSPASEPPDVPRVLAAIDRIAASDLELKPPLDPRADLARDLQLDSLGLITLAVALENQFRVKLSEEDSVQVRTVEDLARLVVRRATEPRS